MKQRNLPKTADLSETASDPRKEWRAARFAAVVTLLFIVALGSCCQFLTLSAIPASPANDLAKHAAAILNFKDAFLDGQWLPRIQLPPAGYPDFPLFQFYSTLLGYLSLPFLLAGLSPLVALTLGIVVIRWVAGIAIFASGRISGANPAASLAGAISYTLTPYILSNSTAASPCQNRRRMESCLSCFMVLSGCTLFPIDGPWLSSWQELSGWRSLIRYSCCTEQQPRGSSS